MKNYVHLLDHLPGKRGKVGEVKRKRDQSILFALRDFLLINFLRNDLFCIKM